MAVTKVMHTPCLVARMQTPSLRLSATSLIPFTCAYTYDSRHRQSRRCAPAMVVATSRAVPASLAMKEHHSWQ